MKTFEYATHPKTGTIHLRAYPNRTTICGVRLAKDWIGGDETVSGLRATCERCRKATA